jgi:uncharacterized protein (TIGR03790 family)
MCNPAPRRLLAGALWSLGCALACSVQGGGSGFNTVVVINQNSANSCELGNYYCERRQVPAENVLRITWSGGNISWSSTEFQTILLTPLLDMLASRQLTNQVDYVVLSMDIPFQTLYGTDKVNSTTSALFYGLKDDSGANWRDVTNSYCASERIFRQAPPASAQGYSFLTTMLTAGSLAQAKLLVDQGVASDGTWPDQPAVLAKTSDTLRNGRYRLFDSAIFNARLLQHPTLVRTNSDSPLGQTNLLGYQTGLSSFTLSPNAFIPGAMADSLSSYGGVIFGTNYQTTLLAFIQAGAAGSYGTVTEPNTGTQKFPSPQNYFYQGRGFTLAECYYQSIYSPYQGLVVGEPLATPFAQTAIGAWSGAASNAVLSGTAPLGVAFSGQDPHHRVHQIDLFVDGKYRQTLTNCVPLAGNRLALSLNGYPLTYTVSTNPTLANVTTGLVALVNVTATSNLTRVGATAYGDRIELRSLASNSVAIPFFFLDTAATNPAGRYYRAQYLADTSQPQVAALGCNEDGAFQLSLSTASGVACVVQASTNLLYWTPIYTNSSGGTEEFVDAQATSGERRFYRAVTSPQPPALPDPSVQVLTNANGILVRVDGATQPCVISLSTNQVNWLPVATNLAPGQAQATVGASAGSAGVLTTFLTASRAAFLGSCASGLRAFNISGTMAVGAWLQLTVTNTNGAVVSLSVTNQSASATMLDLAQQLVTAINSSSSLQGGDGVFADDLVSSAPGTASFNLYARGPGREAAAIQIKLSASSSLFTSPSTTMRLDSNLTDLQPRNHLYLSTGTSELALNLPLDTTSLPDGFHELTAVAYEGTHVHTQSRVTLPVQVRNSSLSASLTLLDLTNTAPAQGTYHLQVAANTNNVSAISLFSTGGLLGILTNQSTATFTVDAAALGVGMHPFYALVQSANGKQYRTSVRWVRLTSP